MAKKADKENITVGTESSGIGVLNEHILHATLKNMIDPDESHHEIKFRGAVVDIMNENGITEIETVSFARLKKKLGRFLTDTKVNVIYPIAEKTEYYEIDKNGVISDIHKSSKKGRATDAFTELLKISEYINSPNLTVTVLLFDATEYRKITSVRGRRKRYERTQTIPSKIKGKITFSGSEEMKKLVSFPEGDFSRKDFFKLNSLGDYTGWATLKTFENCGVISSRKEKNKFIYRLLDNNGTR